MPDCGSVSVWHVRQQVSPRQGRSGISTRIANARPACARGHRERRLSQRPLSQEGGKPTAQGEQELAGFLG